MADKSLRRRLNRLFNTNVIVRRIGKNRIRTIDTDRIQSAGNMKGSRYVDRFARLHGGGTSMGIYNTNYNYHASKVDLYGDYETMDRDSIIASALDIYADECTTEDQHGDVLSIYSSDEKIRKILYNLFYDILNIEFNLWPWVRSMCKYGDHYLWLDIEEEVGVVNVLPVSAYEMIRLEGFNENNPYEVRFVHEGEGMLNDYKAYEIAHFRLITDANFLPYGRSMLEPARKVWKSLTLMEDAMLIHRIMRAPERRLFKIDVGNIPPNEVDAHMETIINQLKKVPFVDPATGEYNLKYNIQNITEDYYIPVRGGQSGTEIDSLSGLEYNAIEDVEYLRDRMMASLKVPKPFLGYEEGVDGKATLASMDIRFARTIERIQKIIVSELTKIAIVHLTAQGFEDADLVNFDIELNNPSIILKQEQLELFQSQLDVAQTAKDLNMLSQQTIYERVFNMSEDEWKAEQLRVIDDLKLRFRHTQIEDEGNDPAVTGESFGTPHDIAALHSTGPGSSDYVEDDHNKGQEIETSADHGRPKEPGKYGTHDSNFTRDPLSKKQRKDSLTPSAADKSPRYKHKGGGPLSLDHKSPMKDLVEKVKKAYPKKKSSNIIKESLNTESNATGSDAGGMLDENNLLDDE